MHPIPNSFASVSATNSHDSLNPLFSQLNAEPPAAKKGLKRKASSPSSAKEKEAAFKERKKMRKEELQQKLHAEQEKEDARVAAALLSIEEERQKSKSQESASTTPSWQSTSMQMIKDAALRTKKGKERQENGSSELDDEEKLEPQENSERLASHSFNLKKWGFEIELILKRKKALN